MRALLLEPDPAWLEDRRRKGLDRLDEVWDGVLHVVPQPTTPHQRFESDLEYALRPVAKAHGLQTFHQIAIYDPVKGEHNYRVPDVTIVAEGNTSERGVEGHAELVVEILSPNDESREKFGFYAQCQIPEYWIVDPKTRAIEVYALDGDRYVLVKPDARGIIATPRFGLDLTIVDGPKLRITWSGGSADV
jgi:Uma2 family endonuclease